MIFFRSILTWSCRFIQNCCFSIVETVVSYGIESRNDSCEWKTSTNVIDASEEGKEGGMLEKSAGRETSDGVETI